MNCPCCSGKAYTECCEPYHNGHKNAATPEDLMRSRYSAFARPNGIYLLKTTLPTQRKFHILKDLQEWGEINQWTKLEILAKPSFTQVEFKAFYTDQEGKSQIHHELSDFKEENGQWYYVSGKFLS